MGIKPPDVTQPFPSLHMIQRAKLLNVEELNEDQWLVWEEGHDKHTVKKETKFYTCDCPGFLVRNVCAHVAAVRHRNVEKDREDLFGY